MRKYIRAFARIGGLALAVTAHTMSASGPTAAQSVGDQLLSSAKVIERDRCSILDIEFYVRVQLQSHSPQTSGDEARLVLTAVDRAPVSATDVRTKPGERVSSATPRRESLRAPPSDRAGVKGIELESTGGQHTLRVYFKREATYRVAPGKDPRHIIIAIAAPGTKTVCEPTSAEDAASSPSPALPQSSGKSGNPALDADMVEARAAMAKPDLDRAIAYLTKVTQAAPPKLKAEALELLGLAQEQKGHLAHARAEYQALLEQFPEGEGAPRIRQRLAGLDRREKAAHEAKVAASAAPAGSQVKLDTPAQAEIAASKLRSSFDSEERAPQIAGWALTHSGSISAYYNRNQGGRDFFVRPRQQQGWEKENIYQIYRNSSLATFDHEVAAAKGGNEARIRLAGSQEHKFTDGSDDLRISQLSFDAKSKDAGSSARFGRQTHYGGGILGRFDGAIGTYQLSEYWKAKAYAGSPVERSSDRPFLYSRYFYGAGADYAVAKSFDVGGYYIEQHNDQLIDRRAIGGDARFVGEKLHGFGTVDYDVHFGEVNTLFGSGTYNFSQSSALSMTLDYRRSPTLFATAALQGQVETSLRDLLRRYTASEIEDLARDRTPRTTVASVSYSHNLNDNLQAIGDFTVTNMSELPASGGIPQTQSTGWDTYTMLQLISMNTFLQNDSLSGALRFATTHWANRSQVELGWRAPFWTDGRIGPIVRFGVADLKLESAMEYHAHGLVRASYNISRALMLEFEAGSRQTQRVNYQGRANENEILLLSGLRYDFNSAR